MNNLLFENGIETAYCKYICANFAKSYFKSKIETLDATNIYVSSKEILGISDEDFKIEKEKYKTQITLMDDALKIWKEKHIKYYRLQPSLPTSSEYSNFIPEICLFEESLGHEMTLDEAVQGYKSANEILKSIPNNDLDKYCIENKLMINTEYAEEYKAIKQYYKDYFGIPSDEEIKSILPNSLIKKTRLSLNRIPAESNVIIDIFIEKFINNMKEHNLYAY